MTNHMTPTEQDNELQEAIYALDRLRGRIDPNLPRIGSVMARVDDIVALITADRKRVALEARVYDNERILAHIQNGMPVERLKVVLDKRIAELKAQQEEV